MKGGRTNFDWDGVLRRLERTADATGEAFEPAPDHVAAVFRQRAERYAAPAVDPAKSAGKVPVLVFRVAGERYGIELDALIQVVEDARCTPVPGGPAALAGVVQVRGEVRPLWQLARLLHLEQASPEEPRSVLLVRARGRETGLQVDAIETVREFAPEELRAPDPGFRHLRWTTADLIPVLDTERLLQEEAS